MSNPEDSSKEDLGQLYDAVPLYAKRGDIEFYVTRATESEGPVLELGCGTGRVLLPTARAGIAITGIERSGEMLDQCRLTLSAEPAEVRDLVALESGDVRSFSLDSSFALVTAPFRVMQLLPELDDQLACLECVRNHLRPGGRFVFDVFLPNFQSLVTDRSGEKEDTAHTPMPDGRVMRRTSRVSGVHWVDQVSDVELIYYVSDSPDLPADRHVHSLRMRWFGRDELHHLWFEQASALRGSAATLRVARFTINRLKWWSPRCGCNAVGRAFQGFQPLGARIKLRPRYRSRVGRAR